MADNTHVADKNDSAQKATGSDDGAQSDDLDSILSSIDEEFDKQVKDPPKKDDRLAALESEIESLRARDVSVDFDRAVETVRDSLDVKVPDRIIRGALNDMASEDPRMVKAFQNRRNDPKAWNRVLDAAAKQLGNELADIVDPKLTKDKAALAAAIQGTSSVKQGDDADFMDRFFQECSDREFQEYKRTGKVPSSFK